MIQQLTLTEISLEKKHSIKRGPFGGALKKEIFVEEGYAVYEQQHAIYKEFESVRYFIDAKKYEELDAFKIDQGDLLISCSGTIGKIAEVPKTFIPGIINQALLKLSLNPELVDNKYFIYLFESDLIQNQLFNLSHGSGLKNFPPMSVIKSIKFPLPPLATQKKIAAILDAADTHRQKTKQLLAKYDELAQSIFLEMFGDPVTNPKGWEVKRFSDIAKIDTRMTKDFNRFANFPHIGVANIEKESGKLVDYNLIRDEGLISGKYHFGPNHIIYSKIRPNLNKVALPDFEGLCSADSYPILAIKDVSNRYFLAFLLRSKAFLDHILQHSARTNIPKANKSQILAFNSMCPPYGLQQEFSKKMANHQKQKQLLEESENEANNLFNSLLQKAFKGKLVK